MFERAEAQHFADVGFAETWIEVIARRTEGCGKARRRCVFAASIVVHRIPFLARRPRVAGRAARIGGQAIMPPATATVKTNEGMPAQTWTVHRQKVFGPGS
jgi:hypothetical protein